MEYNQQAQQWLDTPAEERDLETGARLMLQANRNQILYQNVLRKSNFDKIEYELIKFLANNSQKDIAPIVIRLVAKVEEIKATQPTANKGKRADHDQLPLNVQTDYEQNLHIYPVMRSLHEKLKVLNETGTDLDRLPVLTELLELDKTLRDNWNEYDNFVFVPGEIPKIVVENVVTDNTKLQLNAKQVSAARKYLSDNKTKQVVLIGNGEDDKAAELLEKMQNRYDELNASGETFAPDQLTELKALGIVTR